MQFVSYVKGEVEKKYELRVIEKNYLNLSVRVMKYNHCNITMFIFITMIVLN